MKIFTSMLLFLVTKSAISVPVSRTGRFGALRNERLDSPPPANGVDSYAPDGVKPPSGPYPPSGWAPEGNLLLVPGESHSSQQNNYGTPPPPPSNLYSPGTSTIRPTTITTTEPNQEPEGSEVDTQLGNLNEENGQYYVLLPNGKLQKVQYSGRQRRGRQYEAQVQYEELDPIQAPIYSYRNFPIPLTF